MASAGGFLQLCVVRPASLSQPLRDYVALALRVRSAVSAGGLQIDFDTNGFGTPTTTCASRQRISTYFSVSSQAGGFYTRTTTSCCKHRCAMEAMPPTKVSSSGACPTGLPVSRSRGLSCFERRNFECRHYCGLSLQTGPVPFSALVTALLVSGE